MHDLHGDVKFEKKSTVDFSTILFELLGPTQDNPS